MTCELPFMLKWKLHNLNMGNFIPLIEKMDLTKDQIDLLENFVRSVKQSKKQLRKMRGIKWYDYLFHWKARGYNYG